MGGTQPLRYEFDGVDLVAMTGGTAGPADIQGNLASAIGGGLPRQAMSIPWQRARNFRLRRPCPLFRRYGSVLPVDRTATVVYDPVAVFEVLSPSVTATRNEAPRIAWYASTTDAMDHSGTMRASCFSRRRKPSLACDPLAVERAEFGQFGDEGVRGDAAAARGYAAAERVWCG